MLHSPIDASPLSLSLPLREKKIYICTPILKKERKGEVGRNEKGGKKLSKVS